MKLTKRAIFSISMLLLALLSIVVVFVIATNLTKGFEAEDQKPKETVSSGKVNVKDLVITETKDTKKYWEIYATSGTYSDSNKKATLYGIKGNFYKNNKVIMSFDAPEGEYDETTKSIHVTGGARALTDSNLYIESSILDWQGSNSMVTARKNVKIIKENQIVTYSDKCIFNSDFTNFKVLGNSKTVLYK